MDNMELAIVQKVAEVLTPATTPERFAALAWQAIRKTPALQDCGRESVLAAVMDAARLGLEPDGKLCSIIPRKGVAVCDIGYLGYLHIAARSKIHLHADIVCDGDEFDFAVKHTGFDFTHKYGWNRGKRIGCFAVAWFEQRIIAAERMSAEEIEEVKKCSPSVKGGKPSPWTGPFSGEMWKKTVIRRLCKKLPNIAPELREVEARGEIEVSEAPQQEALTDWRGDAIAAVIRETGMIQEDAEVAVEQMFTDSPVANAGEVATFFCLLDKVSESKRSAAQAFVGDALTASADKIRTAINRLRATINSK